jgi:hypothetical protein
MVNNSTNINKTKESFNSDRGQFIQNQQTKRKFEVELLTITVQTFFWFVDIGGIVDHLCLNFLLVC